MKPYVKLQNRMGEERDIIYVARATRNNQDKHTSPAADKRLIEYLIKQEHYKPFEYCELHFEIHLPIFLERHFRPHRTATILELSRRYTKEKPVFASPRRLHEYKDELTVFYDGAIELYEKMLADGVAPELARTHLPLTLMTTIQYKQNLRNMLFMLKQRLHPSAQHETRMIATGMALSVARYYPVTWDAFCRIHDVEIQEWDELHHAD